MRRLAVGVLVAFAVVLLVGALSSVAVAQDQVGPPPKVGDQPGPPPGGPPGPPGGPGQGPWQKGQPGQFMGPMGPMGPPVTPVAVLADGYLFVVMGNQVFKINVQTMVVEGQVMLGPGPMMGEPGQGPLRKGKREFKPGKEGQPPPPPPPGKPEEGKPATEPMK